MSTMPHTAEHSSPNGALSSRARSRGREADTPPFQVEETSSYKRDFERLGPGDRAQVRKRLNFLLPLFEGDRRAFFAHASRPVAPSLAGGLTSTLYILRATPRIRVLLAYDLDPLFETLTFTLLRVLSHDLLVKDFLKAAEAFHRTHGLDLKK